jgi:hypothetical protein
MTLFPVAAFRACDRLAKEICCRFEPVAVVVAFCDSATSAAAIRPLVYDLFQARTPGLPDSQWLACRTWHRDVLRDEVARLLQGHDLDLVTAPVADDASMMAFCPRCHTQYGQGSSTCAVCADVSLLPLTLTGPPAREASRSTA